MAENLVIECPATPERIDQCPATPDRLLNLKSPNSTTSSDTEWTVNSRAAANNSPPPNCAICLGRCKNKCFTDSCLHQFCFKCLLEWSKVKAECPLCKQPFKSIIHNVKSIDQFEEYLVGDPQTNQTARSIPRPIQHRASHFVHHLATRRSHSTYPNRFDVFLGEHPRFRNGFSATVEVHPSEGNALHQLFLHPSALADRFRQQYPDDVIPPSSLGLLWRQYIYERKLYAMPVVDITGRYRECSARYYRDNPARVHRLMPWIQRDLVCLLRDSEHQVTDVLESIGERVTVFNITSAAFRRSCQQYLGTKTSHFVHELLNFARSPYDMIGYDREVRYTPCYEEVIVSSSNSSSSDSEDVIHIRTGSGGSKTELHIQTRSATYLTVVDIINSQTAPSGMAMASTSQIPAPLNLATTNDADADAEVERTMEHQQGQIRNAEIDRNITLSSSSSDECEFVMERKPPHLRTPELVSLNSESDSDVVFVKEIKKNSPKPTTQRRRLLCKCARPKDNVASDSSDSESETENKVTASGETKAIGNCSINKETNSSNSNNTDNVSPSNINDNVNVDITDSNQEKKLSAEEILQIKGEYNNGASTSSGFRSNGSNDGILIPKEEKQTVVKKYYARPTRQPTSRKRRNCKSIYESSSDFNNSSDSEVDSTRSADKKSAKKRRKKASSKKTRAEKNSKKKTKKSSKRKQQKRYKQRKCRQRKIRYSEKYRSSSSTSSSSSSRSTSSISSSSSSTSQSENSDYSSSS